MSGQGCAAFWQSRSPLPDSPERTVLKEWTKKDLKNGLKTAYLLLFPQRHLTEGDSHRVEADALGSGQNKRHFIGHR